MNLSQINVLLVAKQGLMELDQIRPILVSFFWAFLGRAIHEGQERRGEEVEEEEEEKKRYGTICVWICDFEYGLYDAFVWILVVPFLRFS